MPIYTPEELAQLQQFQLAENLCRVLAYQYTTLPQASTFKVNTKQHDITFDVIKLNAHSDREPVASLRARGMIAIPVKDTSLKTDEAIPLWFTWTGTNSHESALADITEVNAGEHSYRLLEAQFLEESLAAIRATKERFPNRKIELHFTGHSLGGALAQLHFATLQRAILEMGILEAHDSSLQENFQKADESYLKALKAERSDEGVNTSQLKELVQTQGLDKGIKSQDIKGFHLHPWNATGVTQAVVTYTKTLIQQNEAQNRHSQANHIIFLGDPVQQTGTANIFNDPTTQDITILEVTTPEHLNAPEMPSPFNVLNIPNVVVHLGKTAYQAAKKHTGRLSDNEGSINDTQSYQVLTSKKDPEAILNHLKRNKSKIVEMAKKIQPMLFSQLGTVSVNKLIQEISSNRPSIKETLSVFIQGHTQSATRLRKTEQIAILNAMLIQPRLFETLDRLFLQAGPLKDIDTVFDVSVLKKFVEDHPNTFKKHKAFDRVLNSTQVTIKDQMTHFEKTDALNKAFKETQPGPVTIHPSPKKPKA